MKILIYTTEHCPSCEEAKRFLKSKGMAFETVDAEKDLTKVHELARANNWRSMPMIFIDDTFVGGINELRKVLV